MTVIKTPKNIMEIKAQINEEGTESIIRKIRATNTFINYKQPTGQECFEEELYCPPSLVIAELLDSGFDIDTIETQLYSFRLYWHERGERPLMANTLFRKYVMNTFKYR